MNRIFKNFDPEFGKLPDAVYSLEKLVVPYLVEEEEGLRGLESDSRVSYKRAASATNAELKSVESRVKNVARHAKARAAKVYSKIDELEGEIRGLKAKERKARLLLLAKNIPGVWGQSPQPVGVRRHGENKGAQIGPGAGRRCCHPCCASQASQRSGRRARVIASDCA